MFQLLYFVHVGPLTGGTTKDDALAQSNATFSLLLPGDVLDLTALNSQRKFWQQGWCKTGVGFAAAVWPWNTEGKEGSPWN